MRLLRPAAALIVAVLQRACLLALPRQLQRFLCRADALTAAAAAAAAAAAEDLTHQLQGCCPWPLQTLLQRCTRTKAEVLAEVLRVKLLQAINGNACYRQSTVTRENA